MKKTLISFYLLLFSGLLSIFPQALSFPVSPRVIKVNSIPELQQAIKNSGPGDNIVLANGTYTTKESIVINNTGTSVNKITVMAESAGGAEISGTNGFMIIPPASYIIVQGFKFTHNTGTNSIAPGVTHCLITNNIFECAPVYSGTRPYLNVSSDDNEISYNTFQNKKDEGQMLSVQGPAGDRMAKRTWIHHNYFHDFIPPGKNNCSAIQIGLSGRSMDSAFCIIEYNLFVRTEGENEGAICHKACNNIIRFNTFGERSEELSLRHGNNSQVYGNFFINTTGLRFSGDDHLIYNNYFKGCSKAIVCTNGDGEVNEGSKLTCHDRPDRVRVEFNTIIDCKSSYQMAERKAGLGARKIIFTNNIIRGGEPVSIKGTYEDAVWKENTLFNTSGGDMPVTGYKLSEITDNQQYFSKTPKDYSFSTIPDTNRPLSGSDVGFNTKAINDTVTSRFTGPGGKNGSGNPNAPSVF